MKIFENKVWHDGEKILYIDGKHIRDEQSGQKLGYFENNYIYNEAGHKVAYIFENELKFENGNASVPLQKINEEIEGTVPVLTKCAVHVLMEG